MIQMRCDRPVQRARAAGPGTNAGPGWLWRGLIPLFSIFLACSGGRSGRAISVSPLADHLEYEGAAIREEAFTVWGASPVQDDDGRTHLFAARWPEKNIDPAWRKSSEIAHYVAESPLGPFRFSDVTVRGSGRTGEWDAWAPHNPEIRKFGGTYVLVYIANSDYHQPPHPLNQSIGMLTAPSPWGPWTRAGDNGQILDDLNGHFSEGMQVVNPSLIQVDGRYHLYYKTRAKESDGWHTVFGLAVADHLEGPYEHRPEPLTPDGLVIEDASVCIWSGKVCLLTTDNHGLVTGLAGGLVLWVSEDGIHFRPEWAQLAMRLFPDYLQDYREETVTRVYGDRPKAERPKLLMLDGRPAFLYTASGWIYDGSPRCLNHVFRITLPEDASPLPVR